MRLYGVKDIKIGFTGAIINYPNEQVAKRSFTEACKDNMIEFSKHPEDMELWKLGEMDETTGAITSKPEYVIGGRDIV